MFQIGDKVVPIKKSTGIELKHDNNWAKAQESGQDYLYVVQLPKTTGYPNHYNLARSKTAVGKYYMEGDFIPYEEEVEPVDPDTIDKNFTPTAYEDSWDLLKEVAPI